MLTVSTSAVLVTRNLYQMLKKCVLATHRLVVLRSWAPRDKALEGEGVVENV